MATVLRVFALALVTSLFATSAGCGPAATQTAPLQPVVVPVARDVALVAVPPPAFAEPQWQRAAGPPLTLTASDGSGLSLTRLAARAVVDAPLAFTELDLTFDNPRERVIEGTFSITLPPRATITRFAMRTADGFQEGEVVERQQARRAYEDFLHRRQDPALLEQGAGNQFTARVFPIPARGQKELIVSYAEELPGDAPYALALKGMPEIADLDVAVTGGHGTTQTLTQARTVPAGDLVFDRRPSVQGDALRSGRMVVARVKPLADASPDPVRGLLVLFDTSGSRALGFADQTRLLKEVVAKLTETGGAFPLKVACFDQTVESVFDGQSTAFGDRELLAIKARGALGASNVEQALAWAKDHTGNLRRILVVGDGVATAGATDAEHLRTQIAALGRAGVERIDALAVGGIRDEGTLKTLAVGGLAHDGVIVDGGAPADRIVKKIGATTRSGIAVRVDGSAFTYPEKLDGMQPGDEALVYADVPEGSPVRITVGNAPAYEAKVDAVDRPLLERAFSQAHISSMLEREAAGPPSPELHAEIIELAVRHRLITPYTALLVLETDEDYARFDIMRKGLASILTVQDGKLVSMARTRPGDSAPKAIATRNETPAPTQPSARDSSTQTSHDAPATGAPPPPSPSQAGPASVANAAPASPPSPEPAARPSPQPSQPSPAKAAAMEADDSLTTQAARTTSPPAQPAPPPPPPPASRAGAGGGGQGEGIGLGNVGTLGHGAGAGTGQGFGNGHGRLGGAHQTVAPTIRQGATQVNGRLPPEVIQRIVRQNFGRFRLCYENGLRSNPGLQGRVSVRFVIDRSGAVTTTQDAGSNLPDQSVVSCIVRGFGNLSFPQPEGGIVVVVYPIIFSPGDHNDSGGDSGPLPRPVEKPAIADPYTGKLKEVMERLDKKDIGGAKAAAQAWHDEDPGDILGLIALGETLEASHEDERAARAYGTLIDLFPARADMRRFAGSRLDRLKTAGTALALDTYAKAKEERPDHPSSHRLLAYALLKSGAPEKAFQAAVEALHQSYPEDRFPGVHQILQEDVGLIGAAWAKAEPKRAADIATRVMEAGGKIENTPSLRFVLTWETDANDVDFHIYDSAGGHAYYSQKHLKSGGDLYADITTGYGPECFTIRAPKEKRQALYTLQANYYSRGPMGYGMGKLEVIDHDGHGGLRFEEHPYVVMVDHAFVNLGAIKK